MSAPIEGYASEYAKTHDDVFILSAGAYSEEMIRFVTAELDDETLDGIDVHRMLERRDDLASEPVTTAIVIGLSAQAIISVGRIIERWIEKRRQREQITLTIEAFKVSPEAGRVVGELANSHAEVSVAYSLDSAAPNTAGDGSGD